mgnify:CR=1 FL=1
MALHTQKYKSNLSKLFPIFIVFVIIASAGMVVLKAYQSDHVLAPQIALIKINGEINSGMAEELSKAIDKASKDSEIKAVVFEINSPGGSVLPSKELAEQIKSISKPKVAWIREVGASGAYWIASATDKIVADPSSMTGSIGVIGSYLEFSKLFDKYGITYQRLVSGKYKDAGSEFKNMSADEREYLQGKINKLNQMFVSSVAENRHLDKFYVESLATGEIFLGVEAVDNKLIDVLGGKAEAQKTAEKLAKLKSSRLVEYKTEKGFFELLNSGADAVAYWAGRGIGDAITPETSNKIEFSAAI